MKRGNFAGWSSKSINDLQKKPNSNIKSVIEHVIKHVTVEVGGRIVTKHFNKKSKEKDFISRNLVYWCQEKGFQLQEEYRFDPQRKWRFDFYIEALKLGIEYNGIMSAKSRHTTITGYTGDMNKINSAMALGFKVIQFTPLNYKDLLTDLNKLI